MMSPLAFTGSNHFQKLRIGIIGLGNISNIHLQAFLKHENITIQAVADTNSSLLSEKSASIKGVHEYTDYHRLLDDPTVDIVDILLPHFLHRKVICESLESGKIVICEKPLATSPHDVDAVIDVARKKNKQVYLKQYFRFSTLHRDAKNMILRGDIGRPYLVSCIYTTDAVSVYNDSNSWRGNIIEAGGGIFMDVGVHIVDFLQELFGSPTAVTGIVKKNFTSLDTKGEDLSLVTLEYHGNVIANIICTAADSSYGFRWEKHFYGSDGSIHLIDFGKSRIEMRLVKHQDTQFIEVEEGWWDRANIGALHDIIDRILRDEPPAVSLQEAKNTLNAIYGSYLSSKQAKKLYIKYA